MYSLGRRTREGWREEGTGRAGWISRLGTRRVRGLGNLRKSVKMAATNATAFAVWMVKADNIKSKLFIFSCPFTAQRMVLVMTEWLIYALILHKTKWLFWHCNREILNKSIWRASCTSFAQKWNISVKPHFREVFPKIYVFWESKLETPPTQMTSLLTH